MKHGLTTQQAAPACWHIWQAGQRIATIDSALGRFTARLHDGTTHELGSLDSARLWIRRKACKPIDARLRPIKARVFPPTGCYRGASLEERTALIEPHAEAPAHHVKAWVWDDGLKPTHFDKWMYDRTKTPTIEELEKLESLALKLTEGSYIKHDYNLKWA